MVKMITHTEYDVGISEYEHSMEEMDVLEYGGKKGQKIEDLFTEKEAYKAILFPKPIHLVCFDKDDMEDKGVLHVEMELITASNEKATLYTYCLLDDDYPFSTEVMLLVVEDSKGNQRKFRFNGEFFHVEQAEDDYPGVENAYRDFLTTQNIDEEQFIVFGITHN